MSKRKLIIYGVGRFAEYAAYVFENDSSYGVIAFSIEQNYLNKQLDSDRIKQIIPFENLEENFHPLDYDLFIAVGNNLIRERIFNIAKRKGYKLANYISSKASTWENVKYGENCFIGEGCMLNPFTHLGDNNILFNTVIGHHSKIGNHTLLSGTILAGNVTIGNFSFLGLHSSIKENIKIGSKNIIGMNTSISSNTEDNSVYTSSSAIKRSITFNEFYREYIN